MEKRYCIICGNEITSSDPDAIYCSVHGGSQPAPSTNSEKHQTNKEVNLSRPIIDVTTAWKPNQTLLDTYQVVGTLGEGGMGRVYRVHHNAWNMDIAVKQPLASAFSKQGGREDFIREAETWVNLGLHPHITSCYYVRTIQEIPHIFVEFVSGGSLEDWITHKGNHDLFEGSKEDILKRILDIAIQFAWGLGYAHDENLVHQDIKPLNVLMTSEGIVKVTDFGLARATASARADNLNKAGGNDLVSAGGYSQPWCSPEQANHQKLSFKTDIWSWGVSVMEMFSGGLTCAYGQIADTTLDNFLENGPPEGHPSMPPDLVGLLRQCFRENPADRPASMDVIANQLQEIYSHITHQAYPREKPDAAELRADSLNNKALSLLDLGRSSDAIQNWQKALQLDAHHADTTYNYGLWRWRQSEWTDVDLEQALHSIQAPNNRPQLSKYLMGLFHLERDDHRAAEEAFDEALQIAPDDPDIQKAIETSPNNEVACVHTFSGHDDHIWHAVLSPSQNYLATASADGSVRLWDIDGRKELHCLRGHEEAVHHVSFTPDERQLISGGQKYLCLWNRSTGQHEATLQANKKGWVWQTLVTNNGNSIVTGGAGGDTQIEIWDLQNKRQLRILKGHQAPIDALAITPDDRLIISAASTGDDLSVRIWDKASGKCLKVLEEDTAPIMLIRNGRYLLSQGTGIFQMRPLPNKLKRPSGALHIWDLNNFSLLGQVVQFEQDINDIGLDEDDVHVAAIGGREIKIMDLSGKEPVKLFLGATGTPSAIAFLPGGEYILSGHSDGYLRLWQRSNGRCIRSFREGSQEILHLFARKNGRDVITTGRDYKARLYRIEDPGQYQASWSVSRPSNIIQALDAASEVQDAISSASEFLQRERYRDAGLVVKKGLETPGFERDEQLLELWQLAGQHAGTRIGLISTKCIGQDKGFSPFTWLDAKFELSSDQKYAAFIDNDSNIGVWDLDEKKITGHLQGHNIGFPPSDVVFDSQGRRLFSAGSDRTVRFWDLDSQRCIHTISGFEFPVNAVAISSDDRTLFTGGWNGMIQLWDVNSGQPTGQLEGHKGIVRQITPLPGDKYAVSCSNDGTLRVWDLSRQVCIRLLEGHQNAIYSQAIAPDYQVVLSGGLDGTARFWDIASGECLLTLQGHTKPVTQVAFTPDGFSALTASMDGTVRVWNLLSGETIAVLQGHTADVYCIAPTSDSRFLFSSSEDRTIRLWDLKSKRCLQVLEGHTGKITALALTDDNRYLLSAEPGSVRQWRLNWDYAF